MDLNSIVMHPSLLAWTGYWVANIVMFLAVGATTVVIGRMFLEDVSEDGSDAKTVKTKNGIIITVFVAIFVAFSSVMFSMGIGYAVDQSRTESIRSTVSQAIEKEYGFKLDDSQLESLIPASFAKESLPRFYNGSIPDVVNLDDLGESWQSGKVEIGTKDGLKQVFLANDTDGKTYLWIEKPSSKEKLVP